MLKEFRGCIFKRLIIHGDLERYVHHVECIGTHPAGTICLLQLHMATVKTPVEYTDIIQSEEATFKDVVPVPVLAVDPPGKIDEELLKYLFQEDQVTGSGFLFFKLVNFQSCPGVHR